MIPRWQHCRQTLRLEKNLPKCSPKNRNCVYFMMDPGASLNEANMKMHFPWLANQLGENDAQRRGDLASAANGET